MCMLHVIILQRYARVRKVVFVDYEEVKTLRDFVLLKVSVCVCVCACVCVCVLSYACLCVHICA